MQALYNSIIQLIRHMLSDQSWCDYIMVYKLLRNPTKQIQKHKKYPNPIDLQQNNSTNEKQNLHTWKSYIDLKWRQEHCSFPCESSNELTISYSTKRGLKNYSKIEEIWMFKKKKKKKMPSWNIKFNSQLLLVMAQKALLFVLWIFF